MRALPQAPAAQAGGLLRVLLVRLDQMSTDAAGGVRLRRHGVGARTMNVSDPRVFFAAERTLLAWLRTGLTVMGLGFVVARFGLFLRLLALQPQAISGQDHSIVSAVLGVLFVIAGAIAILVATAQHQRFVTTLPRSDLPASYSRAFAVVLSTTVGFLGLLLAAYLVVSHA
jgi:putative membrane protein